MHAVGAQDWPGRSTVSLFTPPPPTHHHHIGSLSSRSRVLGVSVARTLLWTSNDKKQIPKLDPVVILGWAGFGPMDRNEPRIILLYYYIKLYCTQI